MCGFSPRRSESSEHGEYKKSILDLSHSPFSCEKVNDFAVRTSMCTLSHHNKYNRTKLKAEFVYVDKPETYLISLFNYHAVNTYVVTQANFYIILTSIFNGSYCLATRFGCPNPRVRIQ